MQYDNRDTWALLNELRSGDINSALGDHIAWHEAYKERGLIDQYLDEGIDSRTSRADYIRKGVGELYSGPEGASRAEDMASLMLAKRSFTAFNRDLHSVMKDGNLAMGRIIGGIVSEGRGIGVDSGQSDSLVTRALYKVFQAETKEYGNIRQYSGLASTGDRDLDSDRSRFFKRAMRADNLDRLQSMLGISQPEYSSNSEYDNPEDYFAVHYNNQQRVAKSSSSRQLVAKSSVDESIDSIRTELARSEGVNQYSTQVVVKSLLKRSEANGGYFNKPGIAVPISLIESAGSELSINLFQLNNTSIGDVLYNRIMERSGDIIAGTFKVNVLTANSDAGSRGDTGFSILGPNLIQLERLRVLREAIIDAAIAGGYSKEFAERQVMDKFRILSTDRKNHSKLVVTDSFATIGSMNLTRPVGSSVNQEGSTYESVRLLHLHSTLTPEVLRDSEALGKYKLSTARSMRAGDPLSSMRDIRGAITQRVTSAKLFMQVKAVNDTYMEGVGAGAGTNYYETSRANIGGARDILNHLNKTLEYLVDTKEGSASTNKFLMQLDQVYSLSFISDIAKSYGIDKADGFTGEMGLEGDLSNDAKRRLEFDRVQSRLYKLAEQGRLKAVVDVRNYKDKILNPTYELVERILGDSFVSLYDGSLEKLTGGGSFAEKEARLRSRGISNTDLIKQVQLITSGAISLSTMPKQHLKSFMAYDSSKGRAISYYDGSSNLGAFSLGIDDKSNVEFGLMLAGSYLRERRSSIDPYGLSDFEEESELVGASRNFLNRFRTLSGAEALENKFKSSSWEGRVDTKSISRLVNRLDQINQDLGFNAINYDYFYGDKGNRLGVQVSLNLKNLTGLGNDVPGLETQFKYRFSPLKGSGQGAGFVLAVDQGKIINSVRFLNNHSSSIPMPYVPGGSLGAKSSATINAVDNTAMMMATLAGEMINRSLVMGPELFLSSTFGEDGLSKTVIEYMEWVATGKRQGGDWLRSASPSEITKLQDQLVNRLVMDMKGSALTKVREFTGTDTESSNRNRAELINNTVARLEELKVADDKLKALSHIVADWMGTETGMFRDIALDVVASRQDFGYEQYVAKGLRAFRATLMEDKLTLGQASTYGGPQATYRMAQLGIDNSNQYTGVVSALNRSNTAATGLGRLTKYMTFIPRTYGPTDNHLSPGAIVNVAEGGGSRPDISDIEGGVTTFGLYKQSLGDMVDLGIIGFMGIGSVTNRVDYIRYLGQLLGKGTNVSELENDTLIKELLYKGANGGKGIWGNSERMVDTLVTYTFNNKKGSQIPQRLKNVMGSRPMSRVDDWVQNILESNDPSRGMKLTSELDKRVDQLRMEVKDVLRKKPGVMSEVEIESEANKIITEDHKIGLLFGIGIRGVLGNEAARIVDEVRQEIIKELRLEGESDLIIHEPLISEISRGRLVAHDLFSSGIKGFTGVHNKKNPIVLVQLGGAYTDYFYANPQYGGVSGTREGFLERKSVRLKSSMLSADWTDRTSGKPIAQAGDMVSFDKERNRLIVTSADGATKHNVDINNLSQADIDSATEGVNSVGMRALFKGVVDNMRGPTGESSLATQELDVWARPGEDSIEYLLSSNQLVGDPESNQLMYEFVMLRTKKPGGGTRIEGKGVLAKGLAPFADVRMFESILEQIQQNEATYEREYGGSRSGSVRSALRGKKTNVSDVFGMLNPSNLKSYSYAHGSVILRDREMTGQLMSMSDENIAAALLMGFGTDFVRKRGNESDRDLRLKLRRIERNLGKLSIRGDLGYWYKELATSRLLMEDREADVRVRANEYLQLQQGIDSPSASDVDQVLKDSTLYKRFTEEVVGRALMGKAAFSGVQTPALLALEADDLIDVLEGTRNKKLYRGSSSLRTKVRNIVDLNVNKDFANYEDLGQRSAMMVLTAMDVMAQLVSQPKAIKVATDVNLRDDRVLKQMASVVKGIDLFKLDRDKDYKEEVIASLESMITSFPVLRLHMDLAFSSSKEALSSKYEGNLEFQHIIKPMRRQAKAFSEGGKLSDIRGVVANIMAAASDGAIASGFLYGNQIDVGEIQDLTDINLRTMEEKVKFLGIYGSEKNKRELHALQGKYRLAAKENSSRREQIGQQVFKLTQERLNHTRRGTGSTARVAELDRSIANLMSELISSGLSENDELTGRLKDLSRAAEMDEDKSFGIGQAKAVLDAMDESGQPGRAFSLPSIAGVTATSDGRLKVEFDYTNKVFGYIPSAKELKGLGVEFGSFVGEEMKATMILTRGMTVGTSMSKVLDQLARNKIFNRNEVLINTNELEEVINYWNTAKDITGMLTEAASGTRIQKAFAGENRLEGLVSTGAASFLVPPSMMVMAEEGLKRHGLVSNPVRLQAIHRNNDFIKGYEANWKESRSNNDARVLQAMRTQDLGLRVGLSPEAMAAMKDLRDRSSQMQSKLADVNKLIKMNASSDLVTRRIAEMQEMSSTMTGLVRQFSFRGDGDSLAKLLGKEEVGYWSDVTHKLVLEHNLAGGGISLEGIVKEGKGGKPPDLRKIITSIDRRIKSRTKTGYAMQGLAIGSDSSALRLDLSDFTNSVRGREKVYVWDESNWDKLVEGLDSNDQKAFLEHKLKLMIEGFSRLSNELLDGYGDVSTEARQSLHRNRGDNLSALSDLRSLRRGLGKVLKEVGRDTQFDIKKHTGKISTVMTAFDTTGVMEVMGFRSPPPGGTELNRQNLGVIRSIELINEIAKASEGKTGYEMVRYDGERNKTLSMFSPLSMLTTNLGDFDGDSYTTVFNGLMDQQLSMDKSRDRVFINERRLSSSRSKLEQLSNERLYLKKDVDLLTSRVLRGASRLSTFDVPAGSGVMSFDSDRMLGMTSTKLAQVELEMVQEQEAIVRYQEAIEVANSSINKTLLKVNQAKDELNQGEFGSAFRKEVANYMGLNIGFFSSGQDGFLAKDMDVAVLPTLIQQGSGLFGGLEKEGKDRLRLDGLIKDIFTVGERTNDSGERIVSLAVTAEAVRDRVRGLASDPTHASNRGTYVMLNAMDDIRHELGKSLVDELKLASGNTENVVEVGYDEYIRAITSTASNYYSRSVGVKGAQGILNQGAGISMELSSYDMLTKVLGKAGGDILGKTYNTLINTLYADSPLLALGHVLNGSGSSKDAIRQGLTSSMGEEAANALYTQVGTASAQAEGLQGFLKNVHQLLRDSIKLKDDDPGLMDNLRVMADKYNTTTDETERSKIVNDIAGSIGPGPGLKALTNLNDLVLHRELLKQGEPDKVNDVLRDTFGIGTTTGYRYTNGTLSSTSYSQFEVLAEELKVLSGKTEVSAYDVISYKVSEDLKSLVTGFRFDRDKGNAISLMDQSGGYQGKVAQSYGIDKLAKKYGFNNTSELLNSDRRIVEGPSMDGMELLESRVMKGGLIDVVESTRATLDVLANKELDNWFSGEGLSEVMVNRRRTKLATVLGVKDRELDKKLGSMSQSERAYLLSLIQEEDVQAGKWLGTHGEGLDRFTQHVSTRMGLSSVVEGKSGSIVTSEYVEADLTLSMLNLASSNKLNAEASVMFYQHLVNSVDPGLEAPNPNDYIDGKQDNDYKAKLKQYELKLKEAVMSRVGLGGKESYGAIGPSIDKLMSSENIEIAVGEGRSVKYESGTEFLIDQLKETGTGQRVSAVADFLKASARNKPKARGTKGLLSSAMEFAQGLVADQTDVASMMQVIDIATKSGASDIFLEDYDNQSTQYDAAITREHKYNVIASQRSQRQSSAMDLIAPIALTLLGGAVMNGGVSSEMLQQVTGAGFMALGYSKSALSSRPGLAFTGGGFRLNSALQGQEDVGQGLTSWVAREVGFGIGSMVMAPLVQRAVEGAMFKSMNPISGEILEAGESALGRKLKAGAALDVDRFASAKALSGTVSGAVLSAMMGMMLSSAGDAMVASPRPYQTGSIIDYALDSVSSMVRKADQKRVESELADDNNIVVTDEVGGEIIPDSREVTPVDAINLRAIDPLNDIDYTWSTPGYVMVGVTTTTDDLEMEGIPT